MPKIIPLEEKIERLEKENKMQHKEIVALNRRNRSLEKQLSKIDTSSNAQLEKQIEHLKMEISAKEAEIIQHQNLIKESNRRNNELSDTIRQLRYTAKGERIKHDNEVAMNVIDHIVQWKQTDPGNYNQLQHLKNGDEYFDYEFKDYPKMHAECLIFSTEDLFIRISPRNGRTLTGLDLYYLKKMFGKRIEYLWAKQALEDFKKANPNMTNEELVAWTYKKGMELLPLYQDVIF